MNKTLLAVTAVSALALPATSFAAHLNLGIGLNLGAPVYVAPAPVEYAPTVAYAPPPVVYAEPAPVLVEPPVTYGPPVVFSTPYAYEPSCWWQDGYRVCR